MRSRKGWQKSCKRSELAGSSPCLMLQECYLLKKVWGEGDRKGGGWQEGWGGGRQEG
jgi:hypothetical protein